MKNRVKKPIKSINEKPSNLVKNLEKKQKIIKKVDKKVINKISLNVMGVLEKKLILCI